MSGWVFVWGFIEWKMTSVIVAFEGVGFEMVFVGRLFRIILHWLAEQFPLDTGNRFVRILHAWKVYLICPFES